MDKNDPEFSFWNQKDTRIDSLQSELTEELLKIIREVCLDPKAKTNRYLLSDDQRVKEEKLLGTRLYTSGALYESEIEVAPRRLTDRIGAAFRRENDVTEPTEPEEEQQVMEESIIDRMSWTSTTTTEYEGESQSN